MPLFTKRKTTLHIQLTNSDQASCHGGQLLIDALCRRFNLWKRLQDEPSLDPRKRTGAGFTPAANVAQILFTLTSGGACLADAERTRFRKPREREGDRSQSEHEKGDERLPSHHRRERYESALRNALRPAL